MTIQNQEIKEVKASFGVNAEVADAIDKKAVSPGKVQKNGDQEPESIPQGSSLPKTKISMINAVMSKLSQMKKEDVEQQLASMEEDELEEAKNPIKDSVRDLVTRAMKKKYGKGTVKVTKDSATHSNSDGDTRSHEYHPKTGIISGHPYSSSSYYDEEAELDEAKNPIQDRIENTLKRKYGPGEVTFHPTKNSVTHTAEGGDMQYSHAYHPVTGKIDKKPHFKSDYYDEEAELDKRGKMKITREDIDVSEDIAAAFSGSDLSEEFKAQATQIFETAVVSSVNMKLAEMAEQAEEEYAEEMQNIEEGLTTKIDEYLDYVVEQWMKENRLAVESGLRSEVTENFLSGLRNLFAENWIDIPEEKVEVVEELASEVEHITASLDEEMQKNIELKKQVEKFEREIAFVEVSEGLTEMQIAKFESLAEAVDYEDAESYKEKLETIRTSFFESRSQDVTESRSTLDEEFIETYETSEKRLEPNMQVYSAAISRSVKK